MTMEEYAHSLCEKLRAKPTESTIEDVINQLLRTKVDGRPISNIQLEQLLSCMQDELGDYRAIKESFDNSAVLSVMAMVRGMIAQSQAATSNQTSLSTKRPESNTNGYVNSTKTNPWNAK